MMAQAKNVNMHTIANPARGANKKFIWLNMI